MNNFSCHCKVIGKEMHKMLHGLSNFKSSHYIEKVFQIINSYLKKKTYQGVWLCSSK